MQISKATLERLPKYLRLLEEEQEKGVINIPSTVIAEKLNLNSIQVRKDLASVSVSEGKPKTGFAVSALINDIRNFLGYDNVTEAVLVGAGQLGNALLSYNGFKKYGLEIVAGFDNVVTDNNNGNKKVLPISKMEDLIKRMNINIGIITVPAESAQEVCDLMINAGIKAIWNFAPAHLTVPQNVAIKNEDMAASLAVLSSRLAKVLAEENNK